MHFPMLNPALHSTVKCYNKYMFEDIYNSSRSVYYKKNYVLEDVWLGSIDHRFCNSHYVHQDFQSLKVLDHGAFKEKRILMKNYRQNYCVTANC